MARGYRRLSAADEDEIWERLRAGHAAKPTARALRWSTSGVRGYLVRCGGIRPTQLSRSRRGIGSPVMSRYLTAAGGQARAPTPKERHTAAAPDHGGITHVRLR